MTEFEIASLWLRGLVGAGQIAVVAAGILVMRGMNRDRARQAEAQRAEADQRHAEAMRALDALIKGMEATIERTAPKG